MLTVQRVNSVHRHVNEDRTVDDGQFVAGISVQGSTDQGPVRPLFALSEQLDIHSVLTQIGGG